jgi:hypothetical protein
MLADMLQMKAVRVGYVGKAVESLELGSPSQEIFDSVEWKFPRVHGMSDEISQFASEFRSAALVISKHIWLVDWLNDHPNDTLELHQGVGLELKQAWKHARLNGEPSNYVSISGPKGYVGMVIGYDDSRILIDTR